MSQHVTRLCEIPTRWISAKWDENFPYERKFSELARLNETNVNFQHCAFWFAETHSLQYFLLERYPREVSEMNFFPYETKLIFIPPR